MKVLVLEDSKDMVRVIDYELHEYCDITYVENGLEGLDYLSKIGQFDLIISDNQMPIMSGLEFIDKLREVNGSVPVVLFTADSTIALNQEHYKKVYDIQEIILKDLSTLEHFVKMKKKSLTM